MKRMSESASVGSAETAPPATIQPGLIDRIHTYSKVLAELEDVRRPGSSDHAVINFCAGVMRYPLALTVREYFYCERTAKIAFEHRARNRGLGDERAHECSPHGCDPDCVGSNVTNEAYERLVAKEDETVRRFAAKNRGDVHVCRHHTVHLCMDHLCSLVSLSRDDQGVGYRCELTGRQSTMYSAASFGPSLDGPGQANRITAFPQKGQKDSDIPTTHNVTRKRCIDNDAIEAAMAVMDCAVSINTDEVLTVSGMPTNDMPYGQLKKFVAAHVRLMRQLIEAGATFSETAVDEFGAAALVKTKKKIASGRRAKKPKAAVQPQQEDATAKKSHLLESKSKTLKRNIQHNADRDKPARKRQARDRSTGGHAASKSPGGALFKGASRVLSSPYADSELSQAYASLQACYSDAQTLFSNKVTPLLHTTMPPTMPPRTMYMQFLTREPFRTMIEDASRTCSFAPTEPAVKRRLDAMSGKMHRFYSDAYVIVKMLCPGALRLVVEIKHIVSACDEKLTRLREAIKDHRNRQIMPNMWGLYDLLTFQPHNHRVILDAVMGDAEIMECVDFMYHIWTLCLASPYARKADSNLLSSTNIALATLYAMSFPFNEGRRTLIPKHPKLSMHRWLVPLNSINDYYYSRPNNSNGLRVMKMCLSSLIETVPLSSLVFYQSRFIFERDAGVNGVTVDRINATTSTETDDGEARGEDHRRGARRRQSAKETPKER
jgi:hypothetical protein